ncbi:MAG: V-type ATP synthase subunit K, partial [Clostridiales bacterium]|nr:V-type ATP synthase subunit K [Clostridiales bacterium]
MSIGQILALVAAGIAVIVSGIGSSKGVGMAGEVAAGISTEKPEVNSKLLVLQLLPATQGIYGFLIAIIMLINTGVLAGAMLPVTLEQGISFVIGSLPIAIIGYYSAVKQARVSTASMLMTGEKPEMSGKGITMTV